MTDDKRGLVRTCLARRRPNGGPRTVSIRPADAASKSVRCRDVRYRERNAGPRLFGMLCPGDELRCDALIEVALAGGLQRTDADLLYADEYASVQSQPRTRAVLQAGFLARSAAVHQLYRSAVVRQAALLSRVAVTPRALLRDANTTGPALHRASRGGPPLSEAAVRSAAASAGSPAPAGRRWLPRHSPRHRAEWRRPHARAPSVSAA